MAFYLARATTTADGGWMFEDEIKIRLAGPAGPLAQLILNLPADSDGAWNLGAGEITSTWSGPPAGEGQSILLLWDSGSDEIAPMRVLHFSGMSREFETELLVHMEILAPKGAALHSTGRVSNESLRLTGGRATPKARWIWAAPKMAIGSTIVGPQT